MKNESTCFHCGLPVPEDLKLTIRYENRDEPACCAGCQAVAQSIIDAGLGNYYKQRTAEAEKITINLGVIDLGQIDLLVQATESWVKTPMRQTPFPGIVPDESDRAAETRSTLTSSGAMAAVIGFQSPYNDQRSVIALLADSPRGYEMLNDAVNDSGKRATMFGSVAVIRESGINSLRVGDVYYVGHLPWFERLWYALANHPILLAVLAAISVVLLAWVLWRLLRIISRRRLNPDNE